MKIKISSLSDGVHDFSFIEPVENIGLKEPFFGNVTADIELNKIHSQIVLNVKLNLSANFDCDRCNSNYNSEIKCSYKMVYLLGTEPEESGAINVTYLPADADKIVIDSDVRDYAFLAVPMKKLCKDDCKGLCIKCGKDLNSGDCGCKREETDERWLPLLELRNKINNN